MVLPPSASRPCDRRRSPEQSPECCSFICFGEYIETSTRGTSSSTIGAKCASLASRGSAFRVWMLTLPWERRSHTHENCTKAYSIVRARRLRERLPNAPRLLVRQPGRRCDVQGFGPLFGEGFPVGATRAVWSSASQGITLHAADTGRTARGHFDSPDGAAVVNAKDGLIALGVLNKHISFQGHSPSEFGLLCAMIKNAARGRYCARIISLGVITSFPFQLSKQLGAGYCTPHFDRAL
jgi:hypothetical protein